MHHLLQYFGDETGRNGHSANAEHHPAQFLEIGIFLNANRFRRFNFNESAGIVAQATGALLLHLARSLMQLRFQLGDCRWFDERLMVQQHRKANSDWHLDIEYENANLQPAGDGDDVVHIAENRTNGHAFLLDAGQCDRDLITRKGRGLWNIVDGDLLDDGVLLQRADKHFVIRTKDAGFDATGYAETGAGAFEYVTHRHAERFVDGAFRSAESVWKCERGRALASIPNESIQMGYL